MSEAVSALKNAVYIAGIAEISEMGAVGMITLRGDLAAKPLQKAAVAALTGDLRPSLEMTEEFTRRRTRTLELVKAMPGFICFEPQGAFYVFPDVSAYYGKSVNGETIKNAADFSMYLLNTAHVSSVMGDAFGEPNCVRFSFANSMQNIEKAWARIKDALAALQ